MFIIANQPGSKNPFFMTWDDVRAAAASEQWDIQLHAFAGHVDIDVGRESDGGIVTGPFYGSREYDPESKTLEPPLGWFVRATMDIMTGIETMKANVPGFRPTAFAVPYGDYGQISSNDPAIARTMREFLNNNFDAWFTQPTSHPPFAHPSATTREAWRYEIRIGTTANDIVAWLEKSH